MIEQTSNSVAREFSLSFPGSLESPTLTAVFRLAPEDFRVDETLGFSPDGEGEHLLIHLRKRNQNTRWVAGLLAEYYGLPETAIGYCGMKDRRAVTSQWFSAHLPGSTDKPLPSLPECEIISSSRHSKKLRPGMHQSNSFVIVLRFNPEELNEIAIEDMNARLNQISAAGVPNYFGEQRFGREANNLREVDAIVSRKHPRFKGKRGGLYLSAARSWIFNQVLAARVTDGSWHQIEDGPMWGRGRSAATENVTREEADLLQSWQVWLLALEHSGLKQERRPLVLKPRNLQWDWQGSDLALEFTLGPGEYATAVLRELANLRVPESERD